MQTQTENKTTIQTLAYALISASEMQGYKAAFEKVFHLIPKDPKVRLQIDSKGHIHYQNEHAPLFPAAADKAKAEAQIWEFLSQLNERLQQYTATSENSKVAHLLPADFPQDMFAQSRYKLLSLTPIHDTYMGIRHIKHWEASLQLQVSAFKEVQIMGIKVPFAPSYPVREATLNLTFSTGRVKNMDINFLPVNTAKKEIAPLQVGAESLKELTAERFPYLALEMRREGEWIRLGEKDNISNKSVDINNEKGLSVSCTTHFKNHIYWGKQFIELTTSTQYAKILNKLKNTTIHFILNGDSIDPKEFDREYSLFSPHDLLALANNTVDMSGRATTEVYLKIKGEYKRMAHRCAGDSYITSIPQGYKEAFLFVIRCYPNEGLREITDFRNIAWNFERITDLLHETQHILINYYYMKKRKLILHQANQHVLLLDRDSWFFKDRKDYFIRIHNKGQMAILIKEKWNGLETEEEVASYMVNSFAIGTGRCEKDDDYTEVPVLEKWNF